MSSISTHLGINDSSATEEKKIESVTKNSLDTLDAPENLDTQPIQSVEPVQPVQRAQPQTKDFQKFHQRDDDHVNIDDDETIPDIELKSVKELSSVLGNMEYEDIRKGLYKKYGLVSKDEPSVPGYYMITYNKDNRSFRKNNLSLTKEQLATISQYRGVIVEKNTNRPVCYTFNKMSRHLPDEWELSDFKVTTSYDGSQIKIFWNNQGNHWAVSTTRRIDAARSYFFSNKSFMEMFQESSSSLNWDNLDKKCCYSFVLAHPENRVVARHNNPFLTHVFTRNMDTFEIVDVDIGVPKPEVATFTTKPDIWKEIKRLPYYKEGFVVQKGDEFVKLVNTKYQEVKDLRGSSSSLLFHYFHLKKQNKIRDFLSYYPETSETFKYFEKCFKNLCLVSYNEYILLRVRKVIQPPQVLRFLKPVLYKLHGLHLENKIRIKLSDVHSHLETYEPYMLRRLVDMVNGLPYSLN